MKYKHIAVEGNIGAGKTTLTKFLSSILDASALLEEFEENKFLKIFYKTGQFAFQAELQFLLDRSKQLNEFYESNHSLIISDYYVDKSLIFSKMNLSEHEFQLLKNIHGHLFSVFPKPDLLIFLDRSLDVLFSNIMRRNRPYEINMDLNYLKKLDHFYENWIEGLDIPVIRIDAETIDFNRPDYLTKKFRHLLNLDFPSAQRTVKLAIS